MNIENNEIRLTPLQMAKQRYYQKIKSTPEYIEKRNKASNNYYHTKLKHNEDFKLNQSEKKRLYYMKNKKAEFLLEISV